MEVITRRIERWLWPRGHQPAEPGALPLVTARFGYALLRDLWHGDLTLRAMSLVYTTILAIVPLLAFAFSVMKGLGLHRDLEPLIQSFLAPLGPRAAEITTQVMGFVDNVNGSALASISIAILLFTALSMAQKVEGSFNFVWRVDRPRSFARRFSEYLSVLLVGPLFISVAMGFIATLKSTAVMNRLTQIEFLGGWLAALGTLTPYALVIASFSFLYVLVPNTRVRLIPALIGGVFAGVVWAAGGGLFTSFVVAVGDAEAIYSGFAIVIVAIWWLYLSWLILLLGAQLAFYVQNPDYLPLGPRATSTSNALRERLAVSAMVLVGSDFETPGHGWRVESLAARMRVPRHLLEPVMNSLVAAQLLTQTREHRLIPARDLRRIFAVEILAAVRDSEPDTHAHHEDWSATVTEVAATVELAIREALGGRTLADLVAAETHTTTPGTAETKPADPPQ